MWRSKRAINCAQFYHSIPLIHRLLLQSQKHCLELCYYICILNNLSFTSKAQGLGFLFFLRKLTLTCISIKRGFILPISSPWNTAYSFFFCFVLLKAKPETINAWSVSNQHWWVGTWGITSITLPVSNPDYRQEAITHLKAEGARKVEIKCHKSSSFCREQVRGWPWNNTQLFLPASVL